MKTFISCMQMIACCSEASIYSILFILSFESTEGQRLRTLEAWTPLEICQKARGDRNALHSALFSWMRPLSPVGHRRRLIKKTYDCSGSLQRPPGRVGDWNGLWGAKQTCQRNINLFIVMLCGDLKWQIPLKSDWENEKMSSDWMVSSKSS